MNRLIKWIKSLGSPPSVPESLINERKQLAEAMTKLERFTVSLDLTYMSDMQDAVLNFSTEKWTQVSEGIGVRLIECPNWAGTMGVVHAVKGSSFPVHMHPHPERLVFIDGEGSDPVSGRVIRRGESFLAKAHQLHALEVHKDSVMVVSWKFNLTHEAI